MVAGVLCPLFTTRQLVAVAIAATAAWFVVGPSDELITRMQGGMRPTPWRDETVHLGGLPYGMKRLAAVSYLKINGFACTDSQPPGGAVRLACVRDVHGFPCRMTYSVQLVLNPDETVSEKEATSYAGCL